MTSTHASEQLPRTGERLLLGRTLAAAYRILGRHILAFVLLSLILAAATDGPAHLARWWVGQEASEVLLPMIEGAASIAGMVLSGIVSVIIGISWFRVILLGEPHRPRSYLRFGRRGLRYLGVDIAIGCLMAVPFLIIGIIAAVSILHADADMDLVESYAGPVAAIGLVWIAACAAWLGMAYPAISTDACGSGSLRLSIGMTRGSRLPLFFAYLLGVGMWDFAALGLLFATPALATESAAVDFLGTVLTSAGNVCFIAVTAAAYRQLHGRSLVELATAFD